eukprot:6373862-Karenia_brevis.AAC.1
MSRGRTSTPRPPRPPSSNCARRTQRKVTRACVESCESQCMGLVRQLRTGKHAYKKSYARWGSHAGSHHHAYTGMPPETLSPWCMGTISYQLVKTVTFSG